MVSRYTCFRRVTTCPENLEMPGKRPDVGENLFKENYVLSQHLERFNCYHVGTYQVPSSRPHWEHDTFALFVLTMN